jgi:lysophospholipase L1-like esterase
MRDTPPPTLKDRRTQANVAILGLSALLVAGLGVAITQNNRAQAQYATAVATYTPPTLATVASDERETVAFLGDSYTAGTGSSSDSTRWSTLISKDQGWRELNFGSGGTNYATAGALDNGAPYTDRLDDIVKAQPDMVIVSSAGNDVDEGQDQGIRATFTKLREGLPKAKIIATSPYYRAGDYPKQLADFGAEIREQVEAVDGEYLDIGHPLGDHPDAMAEDGAHPNDDGYEYIADAVVDALNTDD